MDFAAHARRVFAKLGEDAVWKPASGAPESTVRGVFNAPYTELLVASGIGIAASDPSFAAPSADLAGVDEGDVLIIAGVEWTVKSMEPYTPGGYTVLKLQKSC